MVIFIFLLALLSFLQSSVFGFNLVLIFLLTRSFIVEEPLNYYLAFGTGLFLGFLNTQPLGILSIIYLIIIKISSILRHLPLASKAVFLLPTIGILQILANIIESLVFRSMIDWKIIIWELIFIYPIYMLIRFWEDRFIPHKDVRLKMRKN